MSRSRRKTSLKLLLLVAFGLFCFLSFGEDAKKDKRPGKGQPSENKGKTGVYQAQTSKKNYKYWVYVPSSYSDSNPAGLHIFFHGQGSGSGAKSFGSWSSILESFNLIGINMEYTDGDYLNDQAGKLNAAEEAVLQTMADYKIVPGRGIMASFSGGGIVHQLYFNQHGKGGLKRRKPKWSFCLNALYGSNFWGSAKGGSELSWFVSLHENERNMGSPTVGKTQTQSANEVIAESLKGGSDIIDAVFLYVKGAGHGVSGADTGCVAQQFYRTDLGLAPFIYPLDYPEPELKAPVDALEELAYGRAETALKQVLASPKLTPELKAKAEALSQSVDKRIERIVAFGKSLSEDDPILCDAYGRVILGQFAGHSRLADVKAAFDPGMQKFAKEGLKKIKESFLREATDMVNMNDGKVNASRRDLLEKTIKAAGKNSQCGMMAQFLLECVDEKGSSGKKK